MPNNMELKKQILKKAHHSRYTMHPGSTKMYHNIKQAYWWNGMKKQITRYVRQCTTCQQVMAEPRKLAGSLQSLETP